MADGGSDASPDESPQTCDEPGSNENTPTDRHTAASESDPVELGLALLQRFADDELGVADVITRLESITTHPRTQRRILDAAVDRGLVERRGSRVRPTPASPIDFEREVVTKEGDFSCRRCGTGISTGYFLSLDVGELGPYGSSCIRKVTGRE